MRLMNHTKSVAVFFVVSVAFVTTGLLLGGGSFRSNDNRPNTDQRSVMIEMLLVEHAGESTDPVLDDLLAVVRPEGGARMMTTAEFDKARLIAGTLAGPSVFRTPTLVSQHNETSSATVSRTSGSGSGSRKGSGDGPSSARVAVTPSVLEDDVIRVSMVIDQTANGVESAVEMTFTSRGGAAMACESFSTDGGASGSAVLLVRPTLVVDER